MDARAVTGVAWPSRYELLDGLRGLAALIVVLNHLQVVSDSVGHFAVMVFFVISGYCITASAETGRHRGVGFKQFMARRMTRIYPPYFFAVVFFVSTRAIKSVMGGQNYLHWSVLEWVQNLTLTQWASNLFHPVASPVQNPSLFVVAFWSLNYEEQFYLVMAVALVLPIRQRLPLVAPVLFLAAIGLVWNWLIPGNWICGFFIEYWVHFALGSCLFFVLSKFTDSRSRFTFITLLSLLCVMSLSRIFLLGTGDHGDAMRAMTELSFLSVVTLALFFLRPFSLRISQSHLWRPLTALGTISYSLYLIHQFNLTLISSVAQHITPARSPHFLVTLTQIVLFVALATLFWWGCERPFLQRKAVSRQALPAGAGEARLG
jgi:peptidoglycan/LPS O-acetylase OafA/YrhL